MISRSPESVAHGRLTQIRMLRKFGVSLITLSRRDSVAVGGNQASGEVFEHPSAMRAMGPIPRCCQLGREGLNTSAVTSNASYAKNEIRLSIYCFMATPYIVASKVCRTNFVLPFRPLSASVSGVSPAGGSPTGARISAAQP